MNKDLTVAIMQPYVYPYLGYFHLIRSCDRFIFFDDVSFIKKGWINRNRIRGAKGGEFLLTIPLKGASQNKAICETQIELDKKSRAKLMNSLKHAYSKAPFFNEVMELLEVTMSHAQESIADMAIQSIVGVMDYLELPFDFLRSSELADNKTELSGSHRILALCTQLAADRYVNLMGGKELYSTDLFEKSSIDLHFIQSQFPSYYQGREDYLQGLSIIDVLMWNSKDDAKGMMEAFTLEVG